MASASHVYDRNGIFYFRAKVNGKLICRSIGPVSKEAAVKIARRLYALEHEKRWAVLEDQRRVDGFASIGEIIEAYRAAARRGGELKERTVQYNVQSLVALLRVASSRDDVDGLSSRILTADLVEGYVDAILQRREREDEGRVRRSIVSTVRQARSLFTRKILPAYRGLKLPELSGFLTAYPGRAPFEPYTLPPKALREATMKGAESLEPDLRVVFLCCYHLGLRASEAVALRWNWFEESDGRVWVHVVRRPDEGFSPKGRAGSVPVPISVWNELNGLRRGDDLFVLPGGTVTGRENLVKREFAKWMRGIGWAADKYPKAAHELRKLIGSQWYKTFGADGARERLRHRHVQTTLDFYAHLDYTDLEPMPEAAVATGG